MEGLLVAALVLGTIITVLWIVLPFAVFGLKARQDRTNELLAELVELSKGQSRPEPSVAEIIAMRRAREAGGS